MSGSIVYARSQTDDPANRHPHDFYPTWPAATRALLGVEHFAPLIWEPAAGAGDMSNVLRQAGHEVMATDLYDYGAGFRRFDFLDDPLPSYLLRNRFDIVTNPPFKLAREFVDRALVETLPQRGKVAMFMRLAMLEGVRRKDWWERLPLARVWVMSRRVPLQRGRLAQPGDGHGVMAFAWFVFDHKQTPDQGAKIRWLDWKEREAAE